MPGLPLHTQAVIATGTPTVLLIFSGGLIDIDDLKQKDIAIVQGWCVSLLVSLWAWSVGVLYCWVGQWRTLL